VFTSSPASQDYTSRANQWAGNLCLPKAAAYQNVVFVINRDFEASKRNNQYMRIHKKQRLAADGRGALFRDAYKCSR
jgi:hypothetical protein